MFEKADAEGSVSEVLGAIKIKSGKGSGVDGVRVECLKSGRKVCAACMVSMLE